MTRVQTEKNAKPHQSEAFAIDGICLIDLDTYSQASSSHKFPGAILICTVEQVLGTKVAFHVSTKVVTEGRPDVSEVCGQ